jgi:hypothetical protein
MKTQTEVLTSYTLTHLDTCLPDYFNGYRETETSEVLAIPVDESTTPQLFYHLLDMEYNGGSSDKLSDGDAFDSALRALLAPYTGDMDCSQSEFAQAIGANYAEVIDEDDQDTESVYCYMLLSQDEE